MLDLRFGKLSNFQSWCSYHCPHAEIMHEMLHIYKGSLPNIFNIDRNVFLLKSWKLYWFLVIRYTGIWRSKLAKKAYVILSYLPKAFYWIGNRLGSTKIQQPLRAHCWWQKFSNLTLQNTTLFILASYFTKHLTLVVLF